MQLTAREEPVGATPLHSEAVAVGRNLITFSSTSAVLTATSSSACRKQSRSNVRKALIVRLKPLSADSSDAVAWLTGNCTRTVST
jgi:hypothetical protein